MKFHHVGIAARRLARTRDKYLVLGYVEESAVIDDPGIGVQLQFLTAPTGPRIELVAPLDAAGESPVATFIERGIHAYHFAYEVPDIEAAIAAQLASGGFLAAAPQPAVAFDGRSVAFVTLAPTMLIEFIQEKM